MQLLSPLSTPVFPTPHICSLSGPCGIESGHSVPSTATVPSGFLCVVLGLLQLSPPWPSYFTCSCPSRHDSEPVLPSPPGSGPFLLVGPPRAVLPPITPHTELGFLPAHSPLQPHRPPCCRSPADSALGPSPLLFPQPGALSLGNPRPLPPFIQVSARSQPSEVTPY